MTVVDYFPEEESMTTSDARYRAASLLNQDPPTTNMPLPDYRPLAFGALYVGDQLKRIADLLEQSTRPIAGRPLEPGRKAPQRALLLQDARTR